MEETKRTVNAHRESPAYPPGLWFNSKAECRRREGRDGAAKEKKIKRKT